MPATHLEAFKTRYHECDAFGYLKPINLLRWMQEAAFAASAAVGYDFTRYDQIGQLWLVRETEVNFLLPLVSGDPVEIKTWVLDFRRFRSRRAYEIRNTRTGALAARASTDWVYLDAATLQPAAIPERMQNAFFPEGPPAHQPPRVRFPKTPSPPEDAFRYRIAVSWHDLDMMWHVNNAKYLGYLAEAEYLDCARRGWPAARMQAAGKRIETRQFQLTYHRPAQLADTLGVTTWCAQVTGETALRYFEVRRELDGALLLQARSQWGFIDLESRRPVQIPGDF